MKKNILIFVSGMLFMLIVGVSASYLYSASDIEFHSENINWEVNNVNDAIMDLYNNKYDLKETKLIYENYRIQGSVYTFEKDYKVVFISIGTSDWTGSVSPSGTTFADISGLKNLNIIKNTQSNYVQTNHGHYIHIGHFFGIAYDVKKGDILNYSTDYWTSLIISGIE